ncbi:MAG: ROK family protein [Pseudomonadota bacterium]
MRIGIDLGGTKIELVMLDSNGDVCHRERVPTPRDDYQRTLDAIAGLVERAESTVGHAASVGIGTPGAISPATGLIKNANATALNANPLDVDLSRRLGREVRTANDANCFALSEAWDGAGADAETVFGVILGTGTGGAVVVHRRVLRGPNAIAGEWGHNPLPWPTDDERPGPRCYCGRAGCIERFLCGPALEEQYANAAGLRCAAADIVRRAEQGDEMAGSILDRYEDRLARALAHVINMLDPDTIVLGGGLSHIGRLYANVPNLWSRWVYSDTVRTQLCPPVHGDAGGARGAAWLWGDESG